jgi:WD40 repeat protein
MKFMRGLLIGILLLLTLPALAQSPTTFFADRSDTAITVENAGDVTQLARLGRGYVTSLAWSPDSETLAVGSSIGVWLYAADDLTAEPTLLSGHTAPVEAVAYSPDGAWLVSGGGDSSVRVWDTENNELLATLEVPYSAAFGSVATDGGVIVGAALNTVIIWDAESGDIRFTLNTTNQITSLAFAPSTPVVAASDNAGITALYNVESGEQIGSLNDLPGDSDIVWLDGEQLARRTEAGWRVLNAVTGETVLTLPATGPMTALTSDGTFIVTGDMGGQAQLWERETGEQTATLALPDAIADLALSPDGETLATWTADKTLRLWSLDDQTQQAEVAGVHLETPLNARFNADATRILAAYVRNTVIEYDLEEGVSILTLGGVLAVEPSIVPLYLPDDGGLVYSDGIDGVIWRSEDEILRLDTPNLPTALILAPDGTLVVSGDAAGTVQLWDASDGTLLATFNDHTYGITSLSFSADGTLLLTSSFDGTVRLYGIAEG